jgi:hypothetical protein
MRFCCSLYSFVGIVTNLTIARQRFGKHRLKAGIATNRSGSLLIGNGSVSTFSATTARLETFPWMEKND